MAKCAFLGLGVMGYPMAGHLLKKGGHDVTVYNRTRGKADALVAQGRPLADATRQAGISAATYHRWRQELGAQNNEPAKRPAEPAQDAPKRIVEGEASAVREPAPASKGHQDSTGSEE